jgi:hypothetical protein
MFRSSLAGRTCLFESFPSTSYWVSVFKDVSVPDGTIDEMLAIAEPCARPKAECFDRPLRDGRVFLNHFPALRTGLAFLMRYPSRTGRSTGADNRRAVRETKSRMFRSSLALKFTHMGSRRIALERAGANVRLVASILSRMIRAFPYSGGCARGSRSLVPVVVGAVTNGPPARGATSLNATSGILLGLPSNGKSLRKGK